MGTIYYRVDGEHGRDDEPSCIDGPDNWHEADRHKLAAYVEKCAEDYFEHSPDAWRGERERFSLHAEPFGPAVCSATVEIDWTPCFVSSIEEAA